MNKELLSSLVGKVVIVNCGGPGAHIGKLLYGEDDHFALLTEKDGVAYFNIAHVKTLSQNMKSAILFNAYEEDQLFLKEGTFGDLLTCLKTQWVKINRGDSKDLEGFLNHSNEHYITLLLKDEVIRIATLHIKSISPGVGMKKEEPSIIQVPSCKHPISKASIQDLPLKYHYSKKTKSTLYLDELVGSKYP